MDPTDTIDDKYKKGKYLFKPAAIAGDLVDMHSGISPTSPSLRMRTDLNGTNTPSAWNGAWRLDSEQEKNLQENFPEKNSDDYKNLIRNVASPAAAPTFGEFSNMKPPYYADFDPNIKSVHKGIIYISESFSETEADLRHKDARFTAYESRNDSSFHCPHGVPSYDILSIIKTGIVPTPVKKVDEIGATDDNNQIITQEYLKDMLDYLNGHKSFNGLSARNTAKYTTRRQGAITTSVSSGKVKFFDEAFYILLV